MNVFILSKNPKLAAKYMCDKHVVKMVLESAQILCSVYPPSNQVPYRRTHINHPCVKWAAESRENYQWLVQHAKALSEEYTKRYGKRHKSSSVINWCEKHSDQLSFVTDKPTPFKQCMPDEYKASNPVKAYRAYYMGEKREFAKWLKGTNVPYWWKN